MERHFTATVYIVHKHQLLLHKHAKLGKWLPPGGHIEPNETPPEAARREAKEETGLDITILEQENLKINTCTAVNFERPFLCLLEHVPAHKDKPAHQHMDMIYIARPKNYADQDLQGFKWFKLEDLLKMGHELFPDTLEMARLLLGATICERNASLASQRSCGSL